MSEQNPQNSQPLNFIYRNWRGEIAKRTVSPIRLEFASTEWHLEPQWLLIARDIEKDAERSFAIKDINPDSEAVVITDEQAAELKELLDQPGFVAHGPGISVPFPTPTPVSHVRVTGFRGNPLRVVLSSGDEATIGQALIDNFASPSPFGKHPDDVAVDQFAAAMKAKLAKKRAEGLGGWDNPDQCHIDYLVHLLTEQIHSRAVLDPIDIGNFAMMIFNRGETPSHGR